MTRPLMKCGHTALGSRADGSPVCPLCLGIRPGADQVEEQTPSLEGRFAYCGNCGSHRPSDYSLPFFEYHPKNDRDGFYCGCRGWD